LTGRRRAGVTSAQLTREERLRADTDMANMFIRMQPGMEQLSFQFTIENFDRLDKQKEPWLGDYRFDHVVKFSLPDAGGKLTKDQEQLFKDLKSKLREALTP